MYFFESKYKVFLLVIFIDLLIFSADYLPFFTSRFSGITRKMTSRNARKAKVKGENFKKIWKETGQIQALKEKKKVGTKTG